MTTPENFGRRLRQTSAWGQVGRPLLGPKTLFLLLQRGRAAVADTKEVRSEILVDKGTQNRRGKHDEGQPRPFSWITNQTAKEAQRNYTSAGGSAKRRDVPRVAVAGPSEVSVRTQMSINPLPGDFGKSGRHISSGGARNARRLVGLTHSIRPERMRAGRCAFYACSERCAH